MTKFCKSRVPEDVVTALGAAKEDKEQFRQVSIEYGIKLCRELQAGGAPGLHFYTLNLEKVTLGILTGLGLNKVPE